MDQKLTWQQWWEIHTWLYKLKAFWKYQSGRRQEQMEYIKLIEETFSIADAIYGQADVEKGEENYLTGMY